MFIPVIIFAIMFATIPVEASSAKNTSKNNVTHKQAKGIKLTPTNKPVRKAVHKKDCVVMVDKKTRKTYTVCPDS